MINFLSEVDQITKRYALNDAIYISSLVDDRNLDSDVLVVIEELKTPDRLGNRNYEIVLNTLVIPDLLDKNSSRPNYYPFPI